MSVSELLGEWCLVCKAQWKKTSDFRRLFIEPRLWCIPDSGPDKTPEIGIAIVWTVQCLLCADVTEKCFAFEAA